MRASEARAIEGKRASSRQIREVECLARYSQEGGVTRKAIEQLIVLPLDARVPKIACCLRSHDVQKAEPSL
eukprot:4869825-Amphidinium_carterae.1